MKRKIRAETQIITSVAIAFLIAIALTKVAIWLFFDVF
jgi:hypothetical protein